MRPYRLPFVLTLCVVLAGPILGGLDEPTGGRTEILAVADHADRAVAVPAWDPASPQRLFRLDGRLVQRAGDVYLPVVEDTLTVRLAADVDGWSDLLARLETRDPVGAGMLAELVPVRENRLGIVDLETPPGADLPSWCAFLHRTGLVRYAEVATHGTYLATQSDPRYPEQWARNNTGQSGGTPGADIDAERAWDLTAGDPSIVVAVIDSGTDIDHEDLAANVWHNDDEIPDNGIDDDGNGFVDDWEGWDFALNDNDPRGGSHGTFVTGFVNAAGSNGVGIAGVAGGLGGLGVRGMALGVGASSPNAAVVDDAILYAADNGAHVITMSLAIGSSQAIDDALDYAYNVKDAFLDCASGNSGSSVAYPGTRPECMAVGATTHTDGSASFSNPGPEVEVSAPGGNVLSTRPGNAYGSDSGTSFAAPQVAGLAALIRSRNPGLPASEVRQLIIDSSDDVYTPGFDERTGWGRINAYEAVSRAATSDGTIGLDGAGYACSDVIAMTVSDIDLAGSGSIGVVIESDTEPAGESVSLGEVGVGSGVFRGTVPVATGAPVADGVLQVAHADTVVATYVDADDGAGGVDVEKTATALVDCLPPSISGVGAESISIDRATIVWDTDEPATSVVRHGATVPPADERSDPGFVPSHAVLLTGLEECTTYKYEVESTDPEGNTAVDDAAGAYHTFVTLGDLPGVGIAACTLGQVYLDRAGTYACDDDMGVAVVDLDLDTDPDVVETVEVLVTSSTDTAGEWLTLTEIDANSSRFEGTVALGSGPVVAGDGVVSTSPGDLVTAAYQDDDDGDGSSRTATAFSTADCVAPFLGDVRVTEISATRAVVEWTTDEPATSRVEFGATPALGSVAESAALVTAHRVAISPFDACGRVHFRVASADEHGDERVADAGGTPFAFNTDQIGGLVFHETFETDTGWQLPGDWERATPQGLGTLGGDPVGAWSGAFAIGNDLTGQGDVAGDYDPGATTSAVSPVFETRQRRNLELIIRRKLGITSADEVGIYVITNGTDQVWTSNYQFNDVDWYEQRKSISAWADNKASVQLEFRIESSDPDHSYGWNIDEVIVKESTEPDYLACGGCAGAPGFAGVTSVVDLDPCGPGGLTLSWDPAASWGTGTAGTYDVHRGTTPDFAPDAGNRVMSGLTATSWTDASAPIDVPVWYVVRARNDESCAGGEGLADGNVVRVGATETTSRPLPAPVGATLVASDVGGAHVRLEWAPSAGAARYVVLRSESWDFAGAVEIGSTMETGFEDPGAVSAGGSFAYRVRAVDACGREE